MPDTALVLAANTPKIIPGTAPGVTLKLVLSNNTTGKASADVHISSSNNVLPASDLAVVAVNGSKEITATGALYAWSTAAASLNVYTASSNDGGVSLTDADLRYNNTIGSKLRRAALSPPEYPGKTPLIAPQAWTASTTFSSSDVGSVYYNGANNYRLWVAAGATAASGGPTGTDPLNPIVDGACMWIYAGPRFPTANDASAPSVSHVNGTPAGLTKAYLPNPASASPLALSARIDGGVYTVYGGGGLRPVIMGKLGSGNVSATDGLGSACSRLSFCTDATVVALGVDYTKRAKIWINGVPLTEGAVRIGAGSGLSHVLLDFTALPLNASRTITLEIDSASVFTGVWVGPSYTIWKPFLVDDLRVLALGDSYFGGASQFPSTGELLPCMLGRRMGWQVTVDGQGGTSFNATNSGNAQAYFTRVATNVLGGSKPIPAGYTLAQDYTPWDMIWVGASTNAYNIAGANTAAEVAAAQQFFSLVRADDRFKSTPIIVSGIANPQGNNLAATQLLESTLFAAINALGDPNIYTYPVSNDPAGPWTDGTGKTGFSNGTSTAAVAGDGKINTRIGAADGGHYIDAGIGYLVAHHERAMKAVIQRIP